MSSVSGSGGNSSSRPDDVNRRNREDYQEKESELVKKHQKEIRKITESYSKEIENLKQSHQQQMDNMRNQSRESMSSRDMRYQKDIDNVRNMHMKQMQAVATDTERDKQAYRKSMEGELENVKARNESYTSDLKENFAKSVKDQAQVQERNFKEVREAQQEAVAKQKVKMSTKHEEELKAVTDSYGKKNAEMDRQFRTYRQDTTDTRKAEQMRNMQNQQRMSNLHMDQMNNERQLASDNSQMLRDGFEDGMTRMRERFEKAANKESEAIRNSRENLSADVNSRITNQVDRLERDNINLKENNTRQQLKMRRDKEKEVENIRNSFGKNIEDLERQKTELLENFNAKNAEDITSIRRENDKLMNNQNRFYMSKIEQNDAKSQQAVENLVGDFEARSKQQTINTDRRVKENIEKTNEEVRRLNTYHGDVLQATRTQNSDEIRIFQAQAAREKAQAVEAIKSEIREREVKHSESMAMLKDKYEKQIADLQDQLTKAKKAGDDNVKRVIAEQKQSHKMDLDTQQVQFQDRLRQMQEQHTNEMKSAAKRNQENVDQLVNTMKKT